MIFNFSAVCRSISFSFFYTGSMERISGHTFYIAKYFHHKLAHLRHSSGVNVAEIYTNGNFKDPETQGGVVNFNLFRANGDYIGFAEVRESAKRGITCKQVSSF